MENSPSSVIACVVVNYNAGKLLEDCVNSWFDSNPDLPLIVVDNASSDGSVDFCRQLSENRPLYLICNDRNRGFSVAVNQGLAKTSTELVMVLNPDCMLPPGTIHKLVESMANDASAGVAGPLLLNPDGTEQAGGRRAVPTPWRSFVRAFGLARLAKRWPKLYLDFYLHKEPLPENIIDVEAISGACMVVRRSALEDVGPMDEGYFMHCEDLDWCMRFRQKGWKIIFVPNAPVVHFRGACSKSRVLFVEWHKHKGMVRFYRKFFRHQYPGVLMWLVVLGVWARFGAIAGYHGLRRVGVPLGLGRG